MSHDGGCVTCNRADTGHGCRIHLPLMCFQSIEQLYQPICGWSVSSRLITLCSCFLMFLPFPCVASQCLTYNLITRSWIFVRFCWRVCDFYEHRQWPRSGLAPQCLVIVSKCSCLTFLFHTWLKIRAVKVSALIYAINVAALFTSGVRCPLTRNRRVANVASPRHRRHGASSLICNFIKVNTNMSHFLFLTLTLRQPPRLLHSPSPLTRQPTSQWEPVIPHSPTPLV